jgi:hypothetical protein
MSSSLSIAARAARLGIVSISMLLSLAIALFSQVSSPDYRRLFLSLLILAVVNVVLIFVVCAFKQKRQIWFVAVTAALGFASLAEMALRVLVGIRLL